MILGVGLGDCSGIVSHPKTPENEGMSPEFRGHFKGKPNRLPCINFQV